MNNLTPIKILDCTLRDGGHVNSFAFGHEQIRTIVKGLCAAKIDIVELGFLKNVTYDRNKTLFANVAQAEVMLDGMPDGQQYSLMIRPDWFDITGLEPCRGKIGILRWAFHARDLDLTIEQASRAQSLGYEIYLNPVNVFPIQRQIFGKRCIDSILSNPKTWQLLTPTAPWWKQICCNSTDSSTTLLIEILHYRSTFTRIFPCHFR